MMLYLAAAYDREIPRAQVLVYWDQLGALDDETFRTACKIVVGQDHHFPSVARLRELYRELLRQRTTRLRVLPAGGERPDPGKVADLLARLRQAVKDA